MILCNYIIIFKEDYDMRKMKTAKGIWTIYGINLIPSDTIYQKVKEAIEQDLLNQSYLQNITGHRNPILIDPQDQSIEFLSF